MAQLNDEDEVKRLLDERRAQEATANASYESAVKPNVRNYIAQVLGGIGAIMANKDAPSAIREIQGVPQIKAKQAQTQALKAADRNFEDAALLLKARAGNRQSQLEAEMRDPVSAYNIAAVTRKAKVYGINPQEVVGQLTDREFDDFRERLLKERDLAGRSEESATRRKEDMAFRREMAKRSNDVAADSKVEANRIRAQKEDDKQIQGLQKSIEGTQGLNAALGEVESLLGSPLDAFSVDKNDNLLKDGKSVDLPGVNIPGIGRITAYSAKARDLSGAAARVFNATLKDRSGAAVTTPEMDRLKEEFNAGKFNTESDLIKGLKRYQRLLKDEVSRRAAAYRPEVREQYIEQGGYIPETGGLSPEKQRRLEELRRKRAQGTLK